MYLPWWAGALAMAAVIATFALLLRRPLAVSGMLDAVLHWRRSREEERTRVNAAEMHATLLAATVAEFGAAGVADVDTQPRADRRPTLTARVLFLIGILAGGAIAALVSARWTLSADLPADLAELVPTGWAGWVVLFGGGALVGVGSRIAGGCTSGHGLHGCPRRLPNSGVATTAFFFAAVCVSLILERVFS